MGREIRRVPLDFNHPLKTVWPGFLNPHWRPCPEAAKNLCHGGDTNAARWLSRIASLIGLAGEEALANTPEQLAHFKRVRRTYPHPWLEEWGMAPRTEVPHEVHERLQKIENQGARFRELGHYLQQNPPRLLALDAELGDFVQRLAGERDLQRGAGAEYMIRRALLAAAGIDPDGDWGICKVCEGHGVDPAHREAWEAWERTPPPKGEGWQLWETVSEGSPVSPVFPTRDRFVQYLRDQRYSEAAAQAFTDNGWAPTLMAIVQPGEETRVMDGIEAAGR